MSVTVWLTLEVVCLTDDVTTAVAAARTFGRTLTTDLAVGLTRSVHEPNQPSPAALIQRVSFHSAEPE
jgi:hypothetical protein